MKHYPTIFKERVIEYLEEEHTIGETSRKHAINHTKVREKVQIDLKYVYFGDIRYFQFTAIDMATRLVFA